MPAEATPSLAKGEHPSSGQFTEIRQTGLHQSELIRVGRSVTASKAKTTGWKQALVETGKLCVNSR